MGTLLGVQALALSQVNASVRSMPTEAFGPASARTRAMSGPSPMTVQQHAATFIAETEAVDGLFKQRFSFPTAPRTRQNAGRTRHSTRLNLSF